MNIHEFLDRSHPFAWGGIDGDDCMTFAASWIKASTGADPAASLRGTYNDQRQAHRLVATAGGLVPLATKMLEPLGFVITDDPQTGDVGIVLGISAVTEKVSQMAAIRFGPLWVNLAEEGIGGHLAETIAAWRVPA